MDKVLTECFDHWGIPCLGTGKVGGRVTDRLLTKHSVYGDRNL